MKHNAQHVVLLHEFGKLLEVAAEEHIDIAPLKGAHVLTSLYTSEMDRGHMADVDFLVKSSDWDRIIRIMLILGFNAEERNVDHEAAFRKTLENGDTILFEAHRHLFDTRRFYIDHEALWARTYSSKMDGRPCKRLSNEDHFCHIAFHSGVHRLSTLTRASTDLDLLVNDSSTDLALVVERAKEWNTTRAVWLFLDLIHRRHPHLNLDIWAKNLRPPLSVRIALRRLTTDKNRLRLLKRHHRIQAAIVWPLIFDSPLLLSKMLANHPKVRQLRKPSSFVKE